MAQLKILTYVILLSGVILLGACQRSVTAVTGVVYFPKGASPTNALYQVVVRVEGGIGKEYFEYSDKQVSISINKRIDNDFKSKYTKELAIKSGDLDWEVTWSNLPDLTIIFYEKSILLPKRLEKQNLHFRYDDSTDRFNLK